MEWSLNALPCCVIVSAALAYSCCVVTLLTNTPLSFSLCLSLSVCLLLSFLSLSISLSRPLCLSLPLSLSLSLHRENSREFGILRAIGLDVSQVTRVYLYEAAAVVLSSFFLGTIIGTTWV